MLAIVIPYYKITYFQETLQSLANQTDKRFKVYIGDDASPDDPRLLIDKYKNTFDFYYTKFDTNIGGTALTKQWERCIALTDDEEWIMILGDDDVLETNVVEEFYANQEQFNLVSNVVRYATVVLNELDNSKSEIFKHPEFETGSEFVIRKLSGNTRSSLSEYFFKKDVYLRYGFTQFPSAFYSDDKAWFDFAEDKKIYSLNNSTVFIRISSESISGSTIISIAKKAEFEFLNYLFYSKLSSFISEDIIFILNKFENVLYFNKIYKLNMWFELYIKYLQNFKAKQIFRFHKRMFLHIYSKFKLALLTK